MLDATVCDIYLIDDTGRLIGRPILTACVDAYSGLCCGYFVSWEGGIYSLRGLMLNVISDKVKYCKQFGITIEKSDWNCNQLPATLVTDKGSEYASYTFEQIAELGITIINLPAYRPELKGSVEKFFDLVQGYYKPHLKGKGVIEPDFQERGAKDYRKEACLTLKQFKTVLLHCIIYYNTKRTIENYPYSIDMLKAKIMPYSRDIWNYGMRQLGTNLISVSQEELILTLLPRTIGKFTRQGLKVNGLRYKNDKYIERFLKGGTVTVAYNSDDVSNIWIIEEGNYICFKLIESRFNGKPLSEAELFNNERSKLVKSTIEDMLQAQIELSNHIEVIANNSVATKNIDIKGVRKSRTKECGREHIDYLGKVAK